MCGGVWFRELDELRKEVLQLPLSLSEEDRLEFENWPEKERMSLQKINAMSEQTNHGQTERYEVVVSMNSQLARYVLVCCK